MSDQAKSYSRYKDIKQIREALKHLPAPVYLYAFICLFWAVEFVLRMLLQPSYISHRTWFQWALTIIVIMGTFFILKYGFTSKPNKKLRRSLILVFWFGSFVCIIIRQILIRLSIHNTPISGEEWLLIPLILAATCIWSYPLAYYIKHKPLTNFLMLSFSIISYALAIWTFMAQLDGSEIYKHLINYWDKFWDLIGNNLHGFTIPPSTNWIAYGLTLLTGCLIVLSWSPNISHAEWNPYPSHRLESPQRRALMALGILIVVIYSQIAQRDRVALLALFFLLSTDMAIMIYCYVMQTEEHVCSLVADYIVFRTPLYLYLSSPAFIYHKMARISQHIIESANLNMAHERGNKMILILNDVVESSKGIQEKGNSDDKADWAFALGLACMPTRRPEKCSTNVLRTYYYDIFDYIYSQIFNPTHLHLQDQQIYGRYILYGLLIGAVKLCAYDSEWLETFGFKKIESDYMHCLRLICPTDEMKIYYTCMTRSIMPDGFIDDETQRISLNTLKQNKKRIEEISSMFYQHNRFE